MIIYFQSDSRIFRIWKHFEFIQRNIFSAASFTCSYRNTSMGSPVLSVKLFLCGRKLHHSCRYMRIEAFLLPALIEHHGSSTLVLYVSAFQTVHCSCNIRLAVFQCLCCLRKITMLGYIIKYFIVFKINIHSFFLIYQFIVSIYINYSFTYFYLHEYNSQG